MRKQKDNQGSRWMLKRNQQEDWEGRTREGGGGREGGQERGEVEERSKARVRQTDKQKQSEETLLQNASVLKRRSRFYLLVHFLCFDVSSWNHNATSHSLRK